MSLNKLNERYHELNVEMINKFPSKKIKIDQRELKDTLIYEDKKENLRIIKMVQWYIVDARRSIKLILQYLEQDIQKEN